MFESSGWVLRESSVNEKTSTDQNIVLAYVQPKSAKHLKSSFSVADFESSGETDCAGSYVSAIIKRFEFSSAL
jgi:hypothetical protein